MRYVICYQLALMLIMSIPFILVDKFNMSMEEVLWVVISMIVYGGLMAASVNTKGEINGNGK